MSVEEAEELFNKFFSNKPAIKDSIDSVHDFAKTYGYVETLSGHRRNIRDAMGNNKQKVNSALRQSFNTIIQGTSATLTGKSVTLLDKFIQMKGLRSKLIVTVHDSIVIDCPPEEVETMATVISAVMENLPLDFLFTEYKGEKIRFPIDSDVEIGLNYNDLVEYDKEDISTFKTYQGYIKYKMALQTLKDYKESEVISDAQYEEGIRQVEDQKSIYQEM